MSVSKSIARRARFVKPVIFTVTSLSARPPLDSIWPASFVTGIFNWPSRYSSKPRSTPQSRSQRNSQDQQCRAGFRRSAQQGFTLIEIAIVLVVIGLILGGVMKGQQLIDSARVRSLITDVNGIRSAWHSFQDRYRALPGDFPNAATQIDSAATPGNGNGKIDDGQERASVWQQLALAGYISGNFDGLRATSGSAHDVYCSDSTCPRNPYNGYYKISFGSQASNTSGSANEFFTGGQIPVSILAQLDLRLDDGKANSGRFRVHKAFATSCTTNGEWDVPNGHVNCAGVLRD